ncbi:MAG: hypothetical protein HY552_05255 [Elusimicrobia bacterium]|nr:hypothetical protein [Elusimicrobiota bacterium]
MRIGLDLDNTLVRYDEVFHREAAARGLIPADLPPVKERVRDFLRAAGREADWTELQGWAYGPGMETARPFPGAGEFLAACRARGAQVRVISHRTRRALRGPGHDLHAAARGWLEKSGWLGPGGALDAGHVFLEETKAAKLDRIREQACTHFVDDLPEFLAEPDFPPGVERLLFDPAGARAGENLPRVGSWEEARRRLLDESVPSPKGRDLEATARRLAEASGLTGPFRCDAVAGAANNRVFRLRGEGWDALLKAYYRRPDDPRDRLGAEAAFSRFAWERGLRALPRPLAVDPAAGAALYAWVEGRRLEPGEADAGRVREALEFFQALNRHRAAAREAGLPDASEACFTLAAHAAAVRRRVEALAAAAEPEAADFARTALAPALARAEKRLRAASARGDAPLPAARRVLSPSDFGFHNALLGADGRLRFLDFEYAGWDDPAKTVCDFFLQPAVPAPAGSRAEFARGVGEAVGDPDGVAARAAALAPLYRVKWACIALNDFLPAGRARRRFALGEEALAGRRAGRLAAARRLLAAAAEDESA